MDDKTRIEQLETANNELAAENAKLRKRLHENSKHTHRVERAYKDAVQLALWAKGYIRPTQRFAERYAMKRRRWQNAIALLRLAGIVKEAPGYGWIIHDPNEIAWRVDWARRKALESRQDFISHLGRHATHFREQFYS